MKLCPWQNMSCIEDIFLSTHILLLLVTRNLTRVIYTHTKWGPKYFLSVSVVSSLLNRGRALLVTLNVPFVTLATPWRFSNNVGSCRQVLSLVGGATPSRIGRGQIRNTPSQPNVPPFVANVRNGILWKPVFTRIPHTPRKERRERHVALGPSLRIRQR